MPRFRRTPDPEPEPDRAAALPQHLAAEDFDALAELVAQARRRYGDLFGSRPPGSR